MQHHVGKIARNLKVKAGRGDPARNMRISMRRNELRHHLEHTCQVNEAIKAMPGNPYNIGEVDDPKTLAKKIRRNFKSPAKFFETPIIYCHPSELPPQLDAGQHRKYALIKNVDPEVRKMNKSPTVAWVSGRSYRIQQLLGLSSLTLV